MGLVFGLLLSDIDFGNEKELLRTNYLDAYPHQLSYKFSASFSDLAKSV
jgi:hypothetical protein